MKLRVFEIAMAFVGVLVGASFASGREALQYFVAFGNWGILGAVITSTALALTGFAMLQLGSYYRAKEHTSVFDSISGPVVSKILDLSTLVCLFCIGFAMFAGAGANLNQQFGWPVWIGATIMLVLVLITGLLDVDKVTVAIGAMTPLIIIMIAIATVWAISTSNPDFSTLHEQATQVPTTLPNWWVSAINSIGLQIIVGVSMAIVIGGNLFDPREAGLGGIAGGACFLFLLGMLVTSLYLTIDTVQDHAMPTQAMVTSINPTLGLVMTVAIYGMIYNTAIGMFYAFGKRVTRDHPKRFYPVYVITVLIGFVLSFIGFSNLIGWVYPILGYMGILIMIIIGWAWWKNRKELRKEISLRRTARELFSRHPSQSEIPDAEWQVLEDSARRSNIDDEEFLRELAQASETSKRGTKRKPTKPNKGANV